MLFSLEDIPVGIVFARHRKIKDCNEAFATLFGYDRAELLESGFHRLYPGFADFVRIGQVWKANLAGGLVYRDERVMMRRDTSRFWCRVHGSSRTPADPFAEAVYCFEPLSRPLARNHRKLTDRQMQIVVMVSQGKTNSAIAREIGLSVRTVESHRARIMREVGVENAAELVAWFLAA